MKKFLTRNKLYMFSLLLVIIFVIVGLSTTIKNNQYLEEYDAITILFYVLMNSFLENLSLLAPIIIFIISTYSFHKNLKSGNIKYQLTRETYKSFLKKNFLKSYGYSTLLLISIITLFISCCFINSEFDFSKAIPKPSGEYFMGEPVYVGTPAMINLKFYDTPIFLIFTFLIVIFLHSIFYANIGLIMCKKNKYFIVSVISSFLVFMGIALISALVGEVIVYYLDISILSGVFNLLGIWVYSDFENLISIIIYALLLTIMSFVFLYFTYKNKEEVIIYSEK